MTKDEVSLFIDTCTHNLSVLLLSNKGYYRVDLKDPKKTLERCHLAIDMCLDALSLKLSDVTSYYVLLGPGSNTGIRLGMTIPRTVVAFNPGIKLYGIDTLRLMSFKEDGRVPVLSDRSGDIYVGEMGDKGFTHTKIKKEDIPYIARDKFIVEGFDMKARRELQGRDVLLVDVLSLMVDFREYFTLYPKEDFLPEYDTSI